MSHVQSSIDALLRTVGSLRSLEKDITRAADLVRDCLLRGGKLMAAGNGGSAADVSDFTTEYVCRFSGDRPPYPAMNLTSDGGLLLATGNDYSFDQVFARQISAFGKEGDVFIAASTSGNSPNILKALEEAQRARMPSIALLGRDGGKAKGLATIELIVPEQTAARIQEAHKFLFHLICELVEPSLQARP